MSDGGPRVALTFDAEHPDRPGCPPGNDERILDLLAEACVRATFFVQGRWALSRPEIARRIAHDEHLVGHHSHFHAPMPLLLAEGALEADLAEGAEAIRASTGADPRPWFRCPFGDGSDDREVLGRLEALGYRNVHWDVELEDWEPWRTGDAIAADALSAVRTHGDGAVVLLHTWPLGAADALRPLIDGLRELGAAFVTVDRLGSLP